jgi:hypothetical protein
MKQILVTGGPVHDKLDDVKIITNRFRGGLMASLADKLQIAGADVTYLTTAGAEKPSWIEKHHGGTVIQHDGIRDYMAKVLDIAPKMDAVILGAAVVNLIPVERFPGKFPSHNYKEGDVINIPFTIAPRIIDRVKKVAPKTLLFGFKLLSEVPDQTLVDAAYGVLAESKAVAIIANDAKHLQRKLIVTGVGIAQEFTGDKYHQFIIARIKEEYYRTQVTAPNGVLRYEDELTLMPYFNEHRDVALDPVRIRYAGKYGMNRYGKTFGSIAVRNMRPEQPGFFTTARKKDSLFADTFKTTEIHNWAYVTRVDHASRVVYAQPRKATLNAPLFDHIFRTRPDVNVIVHYHELSEHGVKLTYYTPGTVQDSIRELGKESAFEIDGHGTFLMFTSVQEALSHPYSPRNA